MAIKLQIRALVLILRMLSYIVLLLTDRAKIDEEKARKLAKDVEDWTIEASAFARAVVE